MSPLFTPCIVHNIVNEFCKYVVLLEIFLKHHYKFNWLIFA